MGYTQRARALRDGTLRSLREGEGVRVREECCKGLFLGVGAKRNGAAIVTNKVTLDREFNVVLVRIVEHASDLERNPASGVGIVRVENVSIRVALALAAAAVRGGVNLELRQVYQRAVRELKESLDGREYRPCSCRC